LSLAETPPFQRFVRGELAAMGKGQEFIRTVNNSIYDVLIKLDVEDGEFWCECDDIHCEERVTLTLREYAALQRRSGVLLSRMHGRTYAAPTYD
jgi:hypothetical protein